jgi:hypothetical protein
MEYVIGIWNENDPGTVMVSFAPAGLELFYYTSYPPFETVGYFRVSRRDKPSDPRVERRETLVTKH